MASSPPPPADGWYYSDGSGAAVGPYPRPQFAAMAAARSLPPATPVFCAAVGPAWAPLSAVAGPHLGVGVGAATAAAPKEKAFVDDDGTRFEWDPAVRRFAPVAEGGAPAAPPPAALPFSVDDMTFSAAAAAGPGPGGAADAGAAPPKRRRKRARPPPTSWPSTPPPPPKPRPKPEAAGPGEGGLRRACT